MTAAAGFSFGASQLLAGNWFSAAWTALLFVLIVRGQLQVGPFRRSGG